MLPRPLGMCTSVASLLHKPICIVLEAAPELIYNHRGQRNIRRVTMHDAVGAAML